MPDLSILQDMQSLIGQMPGTLYTLITANGGEDQAAKAG